MKERFLGICTTAKNYIDNIGTIQTAYGLIVVCVLMTVFIFCIFLFSKKTNQLTRSQIDWFEREGKYLSSIYIELNNSMEYLRYFIFSYRWMHRIIGQYNHLFHGYEGKRLKKLLGSKVKSRLSYFTTFSKLNSTLVNTHNQLDRLRKERDKLYKKNGEVVWAITNSTFYYVNSIEHLQKLCDMVYQKDVILVGSAGNGKTSLMCRISEIAIANKIPCLLINSRDIREDCTEYINKKIPIFPRMRKYTFLYMRLVSLFLFLQGKYFYIFIDAINENDREIFTSSIANLFKSYFRYRRIRILLTCRREYFDSRYKALFSPDAKKIYIFNLQEANYDKRATVKMIKSYMKYFNVQGPFSPEMQEKLMNSLFLTRIFFEVNSNRDNCMLEFRNAEIYKLYFEKIASQSEGINLSTVVNRIAQYMFDTFQFDRVPIEKLRLSFDELESFKKLLDNNLIISRTIREGTGITEREEEYVYFVFDELRDFSLARYLLTLDECNSSVQYISFFQNTTMLFKQKMSPVEGMIKYAYHHFKTIGRSDLCKKILNEYGESDIESILDCKNRYSHRQRTFNNFGFSLIFSEGDDIVSFELDYVYFCIERNCSHYWNIFWFLLRNEYSGFKPNIQLAIDILMCYKNDETPRKILELFFADRADKYSSASNNIIKVDILREWLDAIKKEKGMLTANLKVIVTILAAYDPIELTFREYHDLVMNKELFEQIQRSGACNYIKSLVNDFKEWVTPKSTNQIDIEMLRDISEIGGKF